MEVQQILVQRKSCKPLLKTVSQLMEDPDIRLRIMKVIIQTLYNLGYEKSARELEKQAKVAYYNEGLLALRAAIRKCDFKAAWKFLGDVPLGQTEREHVQRILTMLECEHYIDLKKVKEALQVLARGKLSEEEANQLCEKVVFGDFMPEKEQREVAHETQTRIDSIIDKCLEHDIEPRSMQKIIMFYLQMQKQGLIDCIDDSFSLLNIDRNSREAPMKAVSVCKDEFLLAIDFIKFNVKGDRFLTVGTDGDSIEVRLYENPSANNSFKRLVGRNLEIEESVESVSWSHCEELIALGTQKSVIILDEDLKEIRKIQKFSNLIWCEFNPMSNLLYCGGYFDYVSVWSYTGDEISKIQPTLKVRQIAFNVTGTKMYVCGATSPKIILINLYEEKQEAIFVRKYPIMSVKVQQNGNLVATNQEFVFILNENLNVLHCFTAPLNSEHFLMESHVFQPWIVTMGDSFSAQSMSPLAQTGKGQIASWPGAGAFAVQGDIMVSGREELILWRSGQSEQGIMMEKNSSSSESQEEDEPSQMQMEEEDADSDIDLDS